MTDYQNELVMEHLDLVNWVIRTRISVPNRPLLTYDDFYAIGCEAICRAALKYQADSGEFAPFACRYIYNAIIDHCRAMNYRLQRSVDAGFEEGEVLFDLLAHTTVDFEAEVTDDSASLICSGKGNEDWNCSAPHGAGRLMSRKAAFNALSMEEFQKEMEGIYTTCVVPDTLDESPMAYKSMEEIVAQIGPTAEIIERIRPVYNFKAAD